MLRPLSLSLQSGGRAMDCRERIIEYRLGVVNVGPLARLSVEKFVLSVGARTSAPGGGSVAALLAGLVSLLIVVTLGRQDLMGFSSSSIAPQGCGLSTMVGQMTYGKRQFETLDETIRQLLPTLHDAMINSIPMIDADTDAFNDYMVCLSLSQTIHYVAH